MQSNGNINYSLNKNDFYKILSGSMYNFLPYYYVLIIISFIYLYTLRYKQYFFPERKPKYQIDDDTIHYFKSITYNSILNILELSEPIIEDNKYAGLTTKSYLFVII